MDEVRPTRKIDLLLTLNSFFLIALSILVLNSFASYLFPNYFIYIVLAIAAYFTFSLIDFDVLSLFSTHLYVLSIFLLLVNIAIGQVTRGAVRWIPIGDITIQPAEIVRPFLIIFFANYVSRIKSGKDYLILGFLIFLPLFLIFIQPSLGVAVLTSISIIVVLISAGINKKYFIFALVAIMLLSPVIWNVLADYQRQRITGFIDPYADPLGAGYNSIQSMISVGSGKIFGKGLGKGVQTQLAFLPEKHTDFVFASVAEELGLFGATLILSGLFALLWRISQFLEKAQSPESRAYIAGLFFALLFQVAVNIGMNLGLFPISGLPLPLISAGGTSLLATMISLGIVNGARKK